jgi:hypothetical protein
MKKQVSGYETAFSAIVAGRESKNNHRAFTLRRDLERAVVHSLGVFSPQICPLKFVVLGDEL